VPSISLAKMLGDFLKQQQGVVEDGSSRCVHLAGNNVHVVLGDVVSPHGGLLERRLGRRVRQPVVGRSGDQLSQLVRRGEPPIGCDQNCVPSRSESDVRRVIRAQIKLESVRRGKVSVIASA
jgi:hypothetical protein